MFTETQRDMIVKIQKLLDQYGGQYDEVLICLDKRYVTGHCYRLLPESDLGILGPGEFEFKNQRY